MNQADRTWTGGLNSHDVLFAKIISPANLFAAWREFKQNKLNKQDVLAFTDKLEENIFALHYDLVSGRYHHGAYESFYIYDPKKRHIHKASVRDRLFHHAIHRVVELLFDRAFIFDSYSSRQNKGLHKALDRFECLAWKLSRNNTRVVWVLKCDVKKFFDSIDHKILVGLLGRKISNRKALDLVVEVVSSFQTDIGKGLPLGNLTSQLFANVYLDKLDQFIKRKLGVKNYLRYADDFVILSNNQNYLGEILVETKKFLEQGLLLQLHERKVSISKWHEGIDFLGYVLFSHHRILRTKTKWRMFNKLSKNYSYQSAQSYQGLLKHCRGRGIKADLENRQI